MIIFFICCEIEGEIIFLRGRVRYSSLSREEHHNHPGRIHPPPPYTVAWFSSVSSLFSGEEKTNGTDRLQQASRTAMRESKPGEALRYLYWLLEA